jgi:hypothetical protein
MMTGCVDWLKQKKTEAAVDPEIAEANALRAKLGLKPLK